MKIVDNVIEELREKLFISGGIVTWIISEIDSQRMHMEAIYKKLNEKLK